MTTTAADQEKMIAKIRALLAKAEGTNNQHEAEMFFAKATELMDKYRIEDAAVRDRPSDIGRATFPMAGFKYLRASVQLLGAVARHYGCVVFVAHTGNSKFPTIVGEQSDIEATVMMFRSLIIQRDRACLAEPVPSGKSPISFRTSFALGYTIRIAARLKEIRDAAQATIEGTTSAALEVYGRYEALKEKLGNPGSVNHNRPTVDVHGVGSGDRAARTADLGQDRIESTGPRAITREARC
jgi:hypothetical protein